MFSFACMCRIADVDDLVVHAVTPKTIILKQGWPGVSAPGTRCRAASIRSTEIPRLLPPHLTSPTPGLNVYRTGKSAELLTLEALAREKIKCTTVYCLSQIEQREAALPFDFPRTLNASITYLPSG